jgi:serine/threonine protein kinase
MGVAGFQGMRVGRYQLQDCLGHGSHTAVYRASTPAGKWCALKLIDAQLQGGEDLAEHLRRDAAVLDRIRHPHILPIRDPMASHDMTAVAMPLVRALTLRDLMRGGGLSSELAWTILDQIADSLQSAHQWGLTYKLLKPANILVRDGNVYLAEFAVTGRWAGQMAFATPDCQMPAAQYLAPEQILGERADPRSDIYAFAVLAFELATGTPLYDGAQPSAILRRTLNGPPPSAHARNPRIPREVDGVFRRALARDPQQRHASVRELIAELVSPPELNRARHTGHALSEQPVGAALPVRPTAPALPSQTPERESIPAIVTVDSLIDVLSGVLTGENNDGKASAGPASTPRQKPGTEARQ